MTTKEIQDKFDAIINGSMDYVRRLNPTYHKLIERDFRNQQRKANYERILTTRPCGRDNKLKTKQQ